jgi:hypothetical protein
VRGNPEEQPGEEVGEGVALGQGINLEENKFGDESRTH